MCVCAWVCVTDVLSFVLFQTHATVSCGTSFLTGWLMKQGPVCVNIHEVLCDGAEVNRPMQYFRMHAIVSFSRLLSFLLPCPPCSSLSSLLFRKAFLLLLPQRPNKLTHDYKSQTCFWLSSALRWTVKGHENGLCV